MATKVVNVRIDQEKYEVLSRMADQLGTTLANALSMSATSAYRRGTFDINRDPTLVFSEQTEDRISRAVQQVEAHPETLTPLADLKKG